MDGKFFTKNWNLIILLLVAIAFFIVLDNINKRDGFNDVINNEQKDSISEIAKEIPINNDEDTERDQKIKIISQVFGSHQIQFDSKDLTLKGFFNPEDGVMAVNYASDIFAYQPEYEVVIYQYQNKISASELFDQESLYQMKNGYDPEYVKNNYYDNNYFIVTSDFNYDSSLVTLSLINIFEKGGHTYKISYQKTIKDDVLNTARSWVDGDYKILADEFKNVDMDYAKKIFGDSLRIKNNLSKLNIYNNIKWDTKIIKENNAHADIKLEYPEFKDFATSNGLNKIINDIVLGSLEGDRNLVNEWMEKGASEYNYDPCAGESDYYYECSVNLYSSFKVKSIINDVVSVEIILTDYTGGGNGNHSYPKTIIYDLKTGKQLFIDDLFCGDDYLNNIKEVLKANLFTGPVFDNSLGYLTDEVLLSYLREVSFNDFGLTLSFGPYIFTPGAAGIYNVFIPYSLIENNICFQDNGNSEISIRRDLINLDIPKGLSDSCGFMATDCDGFSFYEGKFNEPGSYDFSSDKAYISVSFNDYKTGSLFENKKSIQIILVPYTWISASSGDGLYVIRRNGNNLDVVSRINVGKRPPENLRIENNKIYFNSANLDGSDNSQECYFKDNILEEKNLICK